MDNNPNNQLPIITRDDDGNKIRIQIRYEDEYLDKRQSFPKTNNWTSEFRENSVDVIPGFIKEEIKQQSSSKVVHRRKMCTPTRRLRPVTDYDVRVS